MDWKKCDYPRNQIRRAGKALSKGDRNVFDEVKAIEIVDSWRAAHAYPLQVVANNLRSRTKDSDIIVVQRLKRLDSIVAKLKRAPWISLYDMQDLAGCRVIVPAVNDVYAVSDAYRKSRIKHKFHHTDDYIAEPKPSGYRGVHMIYKYHSDKTPDYEGYFIEIQFRTKLQHLWSTAVETMGIYTGTNLKAGDGPTPVLRFFSLMSSIFALEENKPIVPDTPINRKEIVAEIKYLCNQTSILGALRAVRVATQDIARRGVKARYYILALNSETHIVSISEYSGLEVELATREYTVLESEGGKLNAVLVSAASISELRYAYPNYFSDIGEFVKMVETIIQEK